MKNISLAALCLVSMSLQADLGLPHVNDLLMDAVKDNNVKLAAVLLKQGANPNHTRTLSVKAGRKRKYSHNAVDKVSGQVLDAPCLLVAVFQENMEMMKLLMSYNVKIDTVVTFWGEETLKYNPVTSIELYNYEYVMPLPKLARELIELLGLKPQQEIVDFLRNPGDYFPKPPVGNDVVMPMEAYKPPVSVPCPR